MYVHHPTSGDTVDIKKTKEVLKEKGIPVVEFVLLFCLAGTDFTSGIGGQLGSTGHGDGNGCDLFASTDGLSWKLLRHIWPFQTGYTTMVEMEIDANGAAKTFGLIGESGGIMESDQMLVFFNFTV